jgi:hypothetical protein
VIVKTPVVAIEPVNPVLAVVVIGPKADVPVPWKYCIASESMMISF